MVTAQPVKGMISCDDAIVAELETVKVLEGLLKRVKRPHSAEERCDGLITTSMPRSSGLAMGVSHRGSAES